MVVCRSCGSKYEGNPSICYSCRLPIQIPTKQKIGNTAILRGFLLLCLVILLLVGIFGWVGHQKSPSTENQSTDVPSRSKADDQLDSQPENNGPNPFTDHDSTHKWFVECTEKLNLAFRRLPDGELRDLVGSMLSDARQLGSVSEDHYKALDSGIPTRLEKWAIEDLKFGYVTSERFAAVDLQQTSYIFDDSPNPSRDRDSQDILDRARNNSHLVNGVSAELDRVMAHPDAQVACPEDPTAIATILGRAKLLLASSLQRANSSPSESFVLLGNSEMLANEANARITCFKDWNGKQK